MLFIPPKYSTQQIATLIITFAVYVAGIRNAGSSDGVGGEGSSGSGSGGNTGVNNVAPIADYKSYSTSQKDKFRPSQLLSEVTELISTVGTENIKIAQNANSRADFQQPQIFSFTNSDAQDTPKQYPPSYLEPNYYAHQISKGRPYGPLVSYNKDEKQFTFPQGNREQEGESNVQKYLYTGTQQQQQQQHQLSSTQQPSLVPTQLHTTPIHIYRDPYTNKINTNQRQQQQQLQHEHDGPAPEPITYQGGGGGGPQEYMVQSILVVGTKHPQGSAYNQQRPQHYQQANVGGSADGENKHPGYVLDEQPGSTYNLPVYSNRYEPVTNAPDYKRREGVTLGGQTERPYQGKLSVTSTTGAKLSYDSHDYPPPSYYKQQTSNFQSPALLRQQQEQQDSKPNYQQQQQSAYATAPTKTQTQISTAFSSGRPAEFEYTSTNYVNKFGNYLKDGAGGGGKLGHDGYYKRPSPHYSNDILYVTPAPPTAPAAPRPIVTSYYQQPQANEAIRRPPPPPQPPTYADNYYQYQIGEIPPPPPPLRPAQQPPKASRQPPPSRFGEYYTTPQRYPTVQGTQSYLPTAQQNYPPPPPSYQTPPSYSASPPSYSPSAPTYSSSAANYSPFSSYPPSQIYAPQSNYPQPPSSQNYRPSGYRPQPPQYQYQLQRPTGASGGGGGGFGGGMSGLASLASFFMGTQQYAPQFASLLSGGGGGSGVGGGLLQALTGGGNRPSSASGVGRPPNMQLIKALENIARNDDLECVPKVLCNMIAGQTQRGQLPSFVTSPAITNFLAGFPAQSPALIYGRAALLGISGGERSCTQTYAQCPKNEYEILYYLNNHRGGFFKFFSEAEEQKPTVTQRPQQHSATASSSSSLGGTSLFSLLSALTSGDDKPVSTTTPHPTTPPTVGSFDITQGIGNFFTNILSDYISGVEYQRRSGRSKREAVTFEESSEKDAGGQIQFPKDPTDSDDFHDEEDEDDTDFHDEEDEEDTAQGSNGNEDFEDVRNWDALKQHSEEHDDTQGRVVFKTSEHALSFFPGAEVPAIDDNLKDYYLQEVIQNFNTAKTQRKLKFPADKDAKTDDNVSHMDAMYMSGSELVHFRDDDENASYKSEGAQGVVNFHDEHRPSSSSVKKKRRGKKVRFQATTESALLNEAAHEVNQLVYEDPKRVLFPDHYEKHIRKGKILNRPILYAGNYDEYTQNGDSDRFVISNEHRPNYNDIENENENENNNEDNNIDEGDDNRQLGPFYYGDNSTQQQQNTHSTRLQFSKGASRLHYNRDAENDNYYKPAVSSTSSHHSSGNYNGNRYSSSANYNRRPNYASSTSASSSNNRYNYPHTNYVSNNRYGNRYQSTRYGTTTTTTRRPPRDDNNNIYVTNDQGVTTHYITASGRKVYL